MPPDQRNAPIRKKIKRFFTGFTRSLRVRQLILSLLLVTIGFTALGLAYRELLHRDEIAYQGEQMRSAGVQLISMLARSKSGAFYPPDSSSLSDLKAYLKSGAFTEDAITRPEAAYYAYLKREGGGLVWSSFAPLETGSEQYIGANAFPTFDIETAPRKPKDAAILKPIKPKGRNNRRNNRNKKANTGILNADYIVHGQSFRENDVEYQMIVVRSASRLQENNKNLLEAITVFTIVSTLLVLLSQLLGSLLVLRPIRNIEKEIKNIEAGDQPLIKQTYPTELLPIRNAINILINAEKNQKKSYREALDNLAHALKTPLAVLQGASSNPTPRLTQQVGEQVQRMNDIVAYQLRRAIVSNHNAIVQFEKVRPILFRLRDSLYKVHRDKNFSINIHIDEYAQCRVEYDDLMEVFGNLINNACRFCVSRIDIRAERSSDYLIVDIDDDGMGFPESNPNELLKRGIRADSKTDGQGIGLAVSADIIRKAGGDIELMMSPEVGARVRLLLPV